MSKLKRKRDVWSKEQQLKCGIFVLKFCQQIINKKPFIYKLFNRYVGNKSTQQCLTHLQNLLNKNETIQMMIKKIFSNYKYEQEQINIEKMNLTKFLKKYQQKQRKILDVYNHVKLEQFNNIIKNEYEIFIDQSAFQFIDLFSQKLDQGKTNQLHQKLEQQLCFNFKIPYTLQLIIKKQNKDVDQFKFLKQKQTTLIQFEMQNRQCNNNKNDEWLVGQKIRFCTYFKNKLKDKINLGFIPDEIYQKARIYVNSQKSISQIRNYMQYCKKKYNSKDISYIIDQQIKQLEIPQQYLQEQKYIIDSMNQVVLNLEQCRLKLKNTIIVKEISKQLVYSTMQQINNGAINIEINQNIESNLIIEFEIQDASFNQFKNNMINQDSFTSNIQCMHNKKTLDDCIYQHQKLCHQSNSLLHKIKPEQKQQTILKQIGFKCTDNNQQNILSNNQSIILLQQHNKIEIQGIQQEMVLKFNNQHMNFNLNRQNDIQLKHQIQNCNSQLQLTSYMQISQDKFYYLFTKLNSFEENKSNFRILQRSTQKLILYIKYQQQIRIKFMNQPNVY